MKLPLVTLRSGRASAGPRSMDTRPLWKARRGLFLVEARAAAHYWGAFASLVPSSYGFPGRAHQNASDPVNKALNYGYGLLLGRV